MSKVKGETGRNEGTSSKNPPKRLLANMVYAKLFNHALNGGSKGQFRIRPGSPHRLLLTGQEVALRTTGLWNA